MPLPDFIWAWDQFSRVTFHHLHWQMRQWRLRETNWMKDTEPPSWRHRIQDQTLEFGLKASLLRPSHTAPLPFHVAFLFPGTQWLPLHSESFSSLASPWEGSPRPSLSVCGCWTSLTMKRALFLGIKTPSLSTPSSPLLHWASCWFWVMSTLGWQLRSISAFDSKETGLDAFYTMVNLVGHYILSNSQEVWWNYRKGILNPK